jgi:hypothetical protein
MPDDPFTLRQADQARSDFAIIESELEAIHKRLSQLPTRREVWQAAMLGMIGGAVAAADRGIPASVFLSRFLIERGLAPPSSLS